MGRTRRLYRARAWYPRPDGTEWSTTRHFQTAGARDQWAQQRRDGYPAQYGDHLTWDGPEESGHPGIPPALRVETTDSDPITWPEEGT